MKAALITDRQFADEFSARPGLIPVSFDYSSHDNSPARLIWLDLDRYHCYEGFFTQSLSMYAAMRPAPAARFSTSLDVLSSLLLEDSLTPSGFIFHPGRSGSTLLAKALARSRENVVFSEAPPHNQVWKTLPASKDDAVNFYRRLVLAMGRRRLPTYRSHFIKFTSYNITQFALIRAAFPDTPALFLFRHPDAVLESSAREVQPFLGIDIGLEKIWTDPREALLDFCASCLAIQDPRFRCLNYADLAPQNLSAILEFFGVPPSSPPELSLMQSEFVWDSKSGRIPRLFVPRSEPQSRADPCLLSLYRRLADRAEMEWEFSPA